MSAAGYLSPSTLEEAAEMLASHQGTRLLAGGHHLLLAVNRAHLKGAVLVDLHQLKELSGIALQPDGSLLVGAMTTLDALMQDQVVSTQFPALSKTAGIMGDAQLRNRATVGGSLAEASPESDLAALFLALDASLNLVSSQGKRTLSMDDFITGERKTALEATEIIASISLPVASSGTVLVYERMKHPATLYALTGVAVLLEKSTAGTQPVIRVAVTGATTFPVRLRSVEAALVGKEPSTETIAEAVNALPESLTFRSDLFGSSEYRRHLVQVLTRRALSRALSSSA